MTAAVVSALAGVDPPTHNADLQQKIKNNLTTEIPKRVLRHLYCSSSADTAPGSVSLCPQSHCYVDVDVVSAQPASAMTAFFLMFSNHAGSIWAWLQEKTNTVTKK